MRTLVALAVVVFAGCQAETFLGTWTGTATLNDGRMPHAAKGSVTIKTGQGIPAAWDFSFAGTVGTNQTTFTCVGPMSTAMATATTASLSIPSTCRITASPDDGCTRELTMSQGDFTMAGDTLTGTGNGRLATSCPNQSSSSIDFGFTLTAKK